MSGSAPGRREVAYRLFAAEYDDAEFSYSESDEERAPNYVVTPTGARVNRLFAVGVLTEVDDVNPEMVRGRVVDPTGAFVTYAGQYQPDALAFLERADPPTFVALTGKARTFEPDDDDVVYSSVRPESVNTVDAETRDRWVVTAAERTVDRIGVMAAAIESDLAGDRLRAALVEAGVDERLADGVALAREFYGTTPAYLGALRDVALDAARVVADERDEARRLDVAPDAAGGPDAPAAADLATLDLSGLPTTPVAADEPDTAVRDGPDDGGDADAATDTRPASSPDDDTGPSGDTESEPATTTTGTGAEPAGGHGEADTPDTATPNAEPMAETVGADTDTSRDDATQGDATVESGADEAAAADAESEPGDFDPGEFEMDDETRREVEDEYGTEFSTADEVDEADIETPAPDEEPEVHPEATDDGGADDETDAATPGGPDDATATEAEDDDESSAAEATDVDLEDAVMDVMERVGDDEGADREDLVAAVVDEHGADPDDVEAAIEDALMSGRCYEPSEGTLKAI